MGITTSTVSQQIAALAREAGTPLIEPDGRRVRLTPAGRRLADHAVTILAAVDAARLDLDPDAEPAGTVRVAGFATAIRRSLLPAVADLAATHPGVELRIPEHEPVEALALLAADDVDLALVYDYNLAPAVVRPTRRVRPRCGRRPGASACPPPGRRAGDAAADLAGVRRPRLDRELPQHRRRGRRPHPRLDGRVHAAHRAPRDSLDLVQDLIVAGPGVGLLPLDQPPPPGAGAAR